ncbi:hypothetical protein BDZ91DRAFT_119419 [Kalaharituber pfeilii]|nr:hypothetical protein BDZ91DRAFT_119419 [Kalaharituber pfeilii]
MSPPASSFPISNSRILPLPPPLVTGSLTHYSGSTLPGITTPQQYHTSNDPGPHNANHYYYSQAHNNTADSYFPTAPDCRRLARSESKPNLGSISSILSSATATDTQSDSSSSSPSPLYYHQSCYWGTSPAGTTATTPRSSIASTPLSGYGSGEYSDPVSYTTREYPDLKEEDSGKRKIRRTAVTPQTNNSKEPVNNKGDEYDCLGRKKPKTPRTPMSWDPEDDVLLKELKEGQRLGWKEIATHFPGRTSHACQFRWRRLVSGTLKYYQGHRRPPVVTTTSSSFASEMAASTASAHTTSPSTTPCARYQASNPATSQHNQPYAYDRMSYHQHRGSFSTGSFSLPSPASSSPQQQMGSPMALPGTPCSPPPPQTPNIHGSQYSSYPQMQPYFSPTTDDEDGDNWTPEEDALLMDRKLCFEEVNVLLSNRNEREIWHRMGKLRWGRGRSESNASGDSDLGSYSGVDAQRITKFPPVPAGRILRSQSIQR